MEEGCGGGQIGQRGDGDEPVTMATLPLRRSPVGWWSADEEVAISVGFLDLDDVVVAVVIMLR